MNHRNSKPSATDTETAADLRLAWTLLRDNNAADAEPLLTQHLILHPEASHCWFLLGIARHLLGRIESALNAFERVLSLQSDHVQAINACANMLGILARYAEALERYRQALAMQPDDPQLLTNIAITLEKVQQDDAALQHYDPALARAPDCIDARLNRGVLLSRLGRHESATQNNRELVERHPELPNAHFNLAESLLSVQRFEETLDACGRALELDPGHALALMDQGLALAGLGELSAAGASFEEARRLEPDIGRIFAVHRGLPPGSSELPDPLQVQLLTGYLKISHGDWSRYRETVQAFERHLGGDHHQPAITDRAFIYPSLSLPVSAQARRTLATRASTALAEGLHVYRHPPARGATDQRPIRIGYLSADFRDHPVGQLSRHLYAAHDRRRFQVFGYSLSADDGSYTHERIRQGCDVFHYLHDLDDARAARRIHADGIDILVDLAAYTTDSRTEILAARPAPLQVSHLGGPGTMGADFIHYKITDTTASPPADAAH